MHVRYMSSWIVREATNPFDLTVEDEDVQKRFNVVNAELRLRNLAF